MTESEVALQAVERLPAWTPRAGDFAFVESAEVVMVDGHIGWKFGGLSCPGTSVRDASDL